MIDLNAATLTPNATDLFSLIPTLEAAPVASTNSSTPSAKDFSALLTEMMGSGPIQIPALPQIPTVPELQRVSPLPTQPPMQPVAAQVELEPIEPPVPVEFPSIPEIVVNEPKGKEPQKAQDAQKPEQLDNTSVPSVLFVVPSSFVSAAIDDKSAVKPQIDKIEEQAQAPAPGELAAAPQPELERAFADVKRFELTVRHEIERPAELHPQPVSAAPAEAPKQAFVTTDPIANVQQQQIPPRVTPIQRVALEVKMPERGRSESSAPSSDTTAPAPTMRFSDATPQVEHIEQAQAAHYVEIPNAPRLQVVRSVAMEVGDADSQVTIRIQERGGDVTMQLNAGSDPLHQDLQSSLGSLMHALRQEQVQVSNVEVSRKSPIDKVRRMKEAR